MTDAQQRLLEIRTGQHAPGSDVDFLLGLIDELQQAVSQLTANDPPPPFSETFREATLRELAVLQRRAQRIEAALIAAGIPLPEAIKTPSSAS